LKSASLAKTEENQKKKTTSTHLQKIEASLINLQKWKTKASTKLKHDQEAIVVNL
jgi:hypothetical protein